MKDYATLLVFGALVVLGCSSNDTQPGGLTTAGAGPAVMAGAPAAGGGGASGAPGASAGSSGGAAGAAAVPTGSAGTAAGAGGESSSAGGAGSSAGMAGSSGGMAGSSGGMAGAKAPAPEGSFQAAYEGALQEMCPSCHIAGGIFPSPDLSSIDRAYDSLVDKEPATAAPGTCGGMGKLVTPGDCDASLLYNKISKDPPLCGRRMPLSSTTVPQAGIDALCAWIKAGAKKD